MTAPILHLVDSLDVGGTERVAVHLANLLALSGDFEVHLCTSRYPGKLSSELADDVRFYNVGRRHRFDLPALIRMLRYLKHHNIQVVHAHSSSIVFCVLAAIWLPTLKVVWHIHFGAYAEMGPSLQTMLFRILGRRANVIITVNQQLAKWAVDVLKFQPDRVKYVPNFSFLTPVESVEAEWGEASLGKRVVSVANIRPEKDQITLVKAASQVVKTHPHTQFLLVGSLVNDAYVNKVRATIKALNLERNVTLLGLRQDVTNVLKQADIAVLSSVIEGLPMALLEYGAIGLPVVATNVGQCADVLDNGNVGSLIPPRDEARLSKAIVELLDSAERRQQLGTALAKRVAKNYSADAAIERISQIYNSVL